MVPLVYSSMAASQLKISPRSKLLQLECTVPGIFRYSLRYLASLGRVYITWFTLGFSNNVVEAGKEVFL